jgi:hypothetical protein
MLTPDRRNWQLIYPKLGLAITCNETAETLSRVTFNKTTFSKITFSTMTFSRMTFNKMT